MTNPDGTQRTVNGRVIGHIVDGTYVRYVRVQTGSEGRAYTEYGSCAFAHVCASDVFIGLCKVFTSTEALSIIYAAIIRIIRHGLGSNRYAAVIEETFVSEFYPGTALSKNSLTALYTKIGQDYARRSQFTDLRMERDCAEHHIIIDGTLKKDKSTINNLSAYSRKAKEKNYTDVSALYAYDLENMEPICAEVL